MPHSWVNNRFLDTLRAEYDRFCEECDVECPSFETYLVMLIQEIDEDGLTDSIEKHARELLVKLRARLEEEACAG